MSQRQLRPPGSSVSGASITFTARITAQTVKPTSPAGTYALRGFGPRGNTFCTWKPRLSARGSADPDSAAATSTGDVKLQRVVVAGPVLVNTETPEVRGAISSSQMEEVPSDRDFLDLSRLEPGVQLLDSQSLAPSRAGAAGSFVGLRAYDLRQSCWCVLISPTGRIVPTTRMRTSRFEKCRSDHRYCLHPRWHQRNRNEVQIGTNDLAFTRQLSRQSRRRRELSRWRGQFLFRLRSLEETSKLEERPGCSTTLRRIFQAGPDRSGGFQRAFRRLERKL